MPTAKQYTEIYYRPFLSHKSRKAYQEFTYNTDIFNPGLLYNYINPQFGVQHEIRMVLEFGIEKLNLADYIPALAQNFYKKRIYFGDIKTAIAKDTTGTAVYDVVYADAVDDMNGINNGIDINGKIYYPASIENQRSRLEALKIADGSTIGIDEYRLPLYMRTAQPGTYLPPLYMRVIPICYALPGMGPKIIRRIKYSGFDFKLLDFEVDRIVVQNSKDNTSAKYLMFPRLNITDSREVDNNTLYGGNTMWGSWDNNPLEKR